MRFSSLWRCYPEHMASYVERLGDDYMLSGSRGSLASIVMAWKEGLSPEAIRDDFPTLRLEQVYGAIAYYLANQSEIDSYVAALATDFEQRRAEQESLNPERTMKFGMAIQSAQHRA